MNGRIYDPTLGRFLQADPHIQAPTNSQSYNRYSYVLNNPMSYTDPSGYFFKKLLRSIAKVPILNMAVHVVLNLIPGCQGWCSAVYAAASTYAVTGSLKAAFTSGIVSAIMPGGDSYGAMFASGLIGGLASKAQGGNFGHGFWSAGLGAAIGGRIKLGNAYANVIVSAVVGGTISKLTGGKFSNGAQTWAFYAAMAQDWGSANRENYGGETKDPKPSIDRNHAEDQGIGLDFEDGSIVGDVKVRCNGSQCADVIDKMNTISRVNDNVDVQFSLSTDGTYDMTLEFYSEGIINGEVRRGEWIKATKTLELNTRYGIRHRSINHETGHAMGLPHMGNGTKNFMSYYGVSKNLYISPVLHSHQFNTMKDAYSGWF